MVQFSKEPNNLYNVNSFKHSCDLGSCRLANAKTVSVKLEKIEGVVLATTNPNKQKSPSSLVGKTVMKKKISRTAKVVAKLPHLSNLAYKQVALPDVEVGSYVLVRVGDGESRKSTTFKKERQDSMYRMGEGKVVPILDDNEDNDDEHDDVEGKLLVCLQMTAVDVSFELSFQSCIPGIQRGFQELGMLRLLISRAMGFETIPGFTLLLGLEAGLDFDCQLHPMLPVII
ncbi:hypothetical protein C5167_012034 [Papaver somniferum]|uniref:Ribosomal eL28/Mak16 domain-containing protein n=1 Tax=Papaver somniferum TaxID=3469 RepID=A0A4Y7J097_PAPSO|nr:hypothetical protein C5167_012034 [Papaver somniferum]